MVRRKYGSIFIDILEFPQKIKEDTEVYRWNDEFSNYFDDGNEWLGIGLWSVYDIVAGIILIIFMMLSLSGCASKEPSVVRTYEVTAGEVDFSNNELITLVEYYEMSDGTWKADEHTYKYRLVITGRMPNAVKDSTYVFLSNMEEITFQKAMMASGLSSNMNDYFDAEVARFVALK